MLELIGVSKTYKNGDVYSAAIKDVNLKFDKTGFISILGGSGCGKSTMLNIIGGLMPCTYGDLVINGISTKNFKQTDWDSYRNNYIGFVFQSYNLIPHLSLVENVELSLSLSGIPVKERRQRAMAAIEQVGLKEHARKNPNQISNGQMQRVAIARAIVHDPQIILADEPTGALDSVNSEQVMDILSEFSAEKLIIVVTHNEELAYKYSTRIIRISDGIIAGDDVNVPTKAIKQTEITETASNDLSANEEIIGYELSSGDAEKSQIVKKPKRIRKKKTPSMPFLSSVILSLKNLSSNIGRTLMTVIAGAIAIVSIALVLGFNNGFNNYVTSYEKQSLATYPITVQKANSTFSDVFKNIDNLASFDPSQINLSQVLAVLSDKHSAAEEYTKAKEIYTNMLLGALLKNRSDFTKDNDTAALKTYIDKNMNSDWGFVKYDYDINPNIYTKNDDGTYTRLAPFADRLTTDLKSLGAYIDSNMHASLTSSLSAIKIWEQMPNLSTIKAQYDLIGGSFPSSGEAGATDVMLVVDKYNQVNDYALYGLGVLSVSDLLNTMLSASVDTKKFTFDFNKFIGKEFQVMVPTEYYEYDTAKNRYVEITDENDLNNKVATKSMTIKISGILRQKQGVTNGCLKGTICYTEQFTQKYIEMNATTELVLKQMQEYNDYIQAINNNEPNPVLRSVITRKPLTINPNDKSELNFFIYLKNTLKLKEIDSPDFIYVYASNVEAKSKITSMIDDFNKQNESNTVTYTDESTAIVASLTATVSTITYVLMAITCISVVVALFMIALLMYTIVQDRTQEIGILRSIGARKLDIMRIFNVESLLLGLFASIVGTVFALIIAYPLNMLLKSVLAISNLISVAWWHSLTLVACSIVLTLISGLIPAIIAANKDPVVALKSE